jgi:alpha-beta hydrolase superfamily lysophospholipase
MRHEEDAFTTVDGTQLYEQCWRPNETPKAALAIVHGHGEHSGRYGNVVEYFVPKGYAVCAFDLRGHGRSPGARGHVDRWSDFLEDVHAFLDHLRRHLPDVPIFLYGHSLGGLIVLNLMIEQPEDVRGVISSAPALDTSAFSPVKLMLAKILSVIMPKFTLPTGLEQAALSRDPAVVKAYAEDPLVHDRATARMGAEIVAAATRAMQNAANLTAPLLLLQGEEDRIVPVAAGGRFFERAGSEDKTLLRYPGGYHEPHNDIEHARVMADLENWIRERL